MICADNYINMLSNMGITIMPKRGVLLSYSNNELAFSLTYRALKKFWNYASAETIEYVNAYIQDGFLLCNVWTASGQGGIVVALDRNDGSIIHISEGAFAVKSLVYNDIIISLCDVSQYGIPAHLTLSYAPFGIKDAWTEADVISCDEISSFDLKDTNNLFMTIEQRMLKFGYDDKLPIVNISNYLKTRDRYKKPNNREGCNCDLRR